MRFSELYAQKFFTIAVLDEQADISVWDERSSSLYKNLN